MNDPRQARESAVYTHGHHESVLRSHRWRTAANSAAYLVPELRPGMRLLDVGCGPGTITADLAELVAPGGRVTAVDAAEDVLEQAAAHVKERGPAGAVDFAVADVHALDFPDDSFDVVHAHQVLQHVGDPVRALREMRRVSPAGRRRGGPRRRLRGDDLVPGRTGPGRVAEPVPAGRPRERRRTGRRAAAARLGAGGGLHGRDLLGDRLVLRHAGGDRLVVGPVGGPYDGLRLRGHRRPGRTRDGRMPWTPSPGPGAPGAPTPTPGSRC